MAKVLEKGKTSFKKVKIDLPKAWTEKSSKKNP